ncbi:cytochrome P450 [Serendipita vermifera]|nr:cytochrome P450 [Serendipita vermifera]
MDEAPSFLLKNPAKICAASVALASLGYMTVEVLRRFFLSTQRSQSYPPGPPRGPLIGTMKSFPKGHFFQKFSEWAEAYGDIVYAPVPGVDVVILNSYEVAHELLSKRPSSTSSRHAGYLFINLMEWHWSLIHIQATQSHSNQRKMLRQAIGPQRVGSHDFMIESTVANLMVELETFQGNPNLTIQRALGRMIVKVTYGEQIWEEMGEELMQWNLTAVEQANEAFFAFWLVDMFHFCKSFGLDLLVRFIPDWVPGLQFKNGPYKRGLELYKSGALGHCILNDLFEEFGDGGDARDATAILYTRAIISFLHALFLYPEIAQRMFQEVQLVTHGLRLPKVSDMSSLPYCQAVFKESMRKRPFLPLGVPHVNDQDEILRGYLIPKETVIHQNNGAILNDPRVWGDPDVFMPERHLGPESTQIPNPLTIIFGYGLRICPGMYLGERLALHLVITLNSLFQIVPLEGQKVPDPKTVEYTDVVVQQPVGFECRFIPRDEKTRDLVKVISLSE